VKVGLVGCGKLGYPVAVAMAHRGHSVMAYDVRDEAMRHRPNLVEEGAEGFSFPTLSASAKATDCLTFGSLKQVVAHADTIFVAVQTPHEPEYEGITPIPAERADFDYTHLEDAVRSVSAEVERQGNPRTIVVISTVLPGTMRSRVRPLLGASSRLVYNPSFIAMGTVIRDFLDPEFVLLGGDDGTLARFYRTITAAPIHNCSVESAELAKVAYNAFIGVKITLANTVMEVSHKTGADCDQVMGALKLANRRLISTAYLEPGMGDGGGCHPRDQIALSWLARKLDLSFDFFDAVAECRVRQAEWLCDLMLAHGGHLPLVVLGTAFKSGTDIETGSPALLCVNLLRGKGHVVGAVNDAPEFADPSCFLIGCKHLEFADYEFPKGSVVIDPHRYIPEREGVKVVWVGRG
jgi:UDPglucose 6-dehydrogenase